MTGCLLVIASIAKQSPAIERYSNRTCSMQKIATGASTLAMTGCLLVIASIAKQSHAIESNIKKRGAFRKRFSFLLYTNSMSAASALSPLRKPILSTRV